ncbi:MAG: helix-turn-helix domain-containing protein [Proteobacteria bacterium]|nr:MAG: helix-turn-helix domain-containing protein [Pseudomonadota bacterium]
MNFKTRAKKSGLTFKDIAKGVGTSPVYLSQINTGVRRPSLELCERIEQFTKGKITRRHLRPDWYGGSK